VAKQSKTTQLQIRISPAEKAAIQTAARRAGMEMSAYVLSRALPSAATKFRSCLEGCRDPDTARFALAELNRLLAQLTANEVREAVAQSPPAQLSAYMANYVAAMVEQACGQRAVPVPAWTRLIPPLIEPVFGSTLQSLRLHLLTHAPPPFRRRNIFIDATLGAQV
jgi:hypothetical protein